MSTLSSSPDFPEFPKLIRDNIPEIVMNNHSVSIDSRILTESEFKEFLFRKLIEESKEVYCAKTSLNDLIIELADVYEVIDTILQLHQIDKNQVLKIQKNKRLTNGGFSKKLLMLGKR